MLFRTSICVFSNRLEVVVVTLIWVKKQITVFVYLIARYLTGRYFKIVLGHFSFDAVFILLKRSFGSIKATPNDLHSRFKVVCVWIEVEPGHDRMMRYVLLKGQP